MNVKKEVICKFIELEKIFKNNFDLSMSTILIKKNNEYLNECLKIINNKIFNNLPIEIIDNIFLKLSIKELYKMRNICKYWQRIIDKIINQHIYYIIDLNNNIFSISFNNKYYNKCKFIRDVKKIGSIYFNAKDRKEFYYMFCKVFSQNTINKICLITYNYKFLRLIKDFKIDILEFYILYNIFKSENNTFYRTSRHYNKLCKDSENIENIICLFKDTQISLCFDNFSKIGLLEKNSLLNKVNILNLKYIEYYYDNKLIESFDKNIALLNKLNTLILNHHLVKAISIEKYKFKKEYILNFSLCLLKININLEIKYFEQILTLLKNNPIIKNIYLPDVYSTSNYSNKLVNLKLEKITFIK